MEEKEGGVHPDLDALSGDTLRVQLINALLSHA